MVGLAKVRRHMFANDHTPMVEELLVFKDEAERQLYIDATKKALDYVNQYQWQTVELIPKELP